MTIWKSRKGYWYLTLTNLPSGVEVRVGPLVEKPVQVGLMTTWKEYPDGRRVDYTYDFKAGEKTFSVIWHAWEKPYNSERHLPWAEVIVY